MGVMLFTKLSARAACAQPDLPNWSMRSKGALLAVDSARQARQIRLRTTDFNASSGTHASTSQPCR
jgi:hypothetical protein